MAVITPQRWGWNADPDAQMLGADAIADPHLGQVAVALDVPAWSIGSGQADGDAQLHQFMEFDRETSRRGESIVPAPLTSDPHLVHGAGGDIVTQPPGPVDGGPPPHGPFGPLPDPAGGKKKKKKKKKSSGGGGTKIKVSGGKGSGGSGGKLPDLLGNLPAPTQPATAAASGPNWGVLLLLAAAIGLVWWWWHKHHAAKAGGASPPPHPAG